MIRTIIITLLNIAIPFLLRGLYIYAMRLIAKNKNKKNTTETTLPEWYFPIKKLILIGLLLSILSIAFIRFFFTDIDQPYVGNIAKSEQVP